MYILTAPIFGSKHLIGLFAVAILIVVALFLLNKKETNKKIQEIVILIAAILFVVLEAWKILFIMDGTWEYPMNHVPLHLCSAPLYLYTLLVIFRNNEKVKAWVLPAAYGVTMIAGIVALAYPSNIIGNELTWALVEDNVLVYISFFYHGLMIFMPIYLIRTRYYQFQFKDVYKALVLTYGFMVVALIANYTLEQDFMLLTEGNGSPFQFLLDINQFVYTGTMVLLGTFMITLTFLITKLVVKKG